MSKEYTKTVEELEKIFAEDELYKDNDFSFQIVKKLLRGYESNEIKFFNQYSYQLALALLVAGRNSITNALRSVPVTFENGSAANLSYVAEMLRITSSILSMITVNRDDIAHFFDSNNLPAPLALFPHRPDTTDHVISVANNNCQGWSTTVDLIEVINLVTALRKGIIPANPDTNNGKKTTGRKNKLSLDECHYFFIEYTEKKRSYANIADHHNWMKSSYKDNPNSSTRKSRVIKAVERYRKYLATISLNHL